MAGRTTWIVLLVAMGFSGCFNQPEGPNSDGDCENLGDATPPECQTDGGMTGRDGGIDCRSAAHPDAPVCASNPVDDPASDGSTIFVTDTEGDFLVSFEDMAGTGWASLGNRGSGLGQFDYPAFMGTDPEGRIYVADHQNRRIVRMEDITGRGWTEMADVQSLSVHIDAQGRSLVASDPTGLVRYADFDGNGKETYPGPPIPGSTFVTTDEQGRIYVVDNLRNRIVRMDDFQGTGLVAFGTLGNGVGQFDWPISLTLHGGYIYVLDEHNDRIVRMDDMQGTGWTTFSEVGELPLSRPHQMAITPSGRMYIADTGNSRIVRMDDFTGREAIAYGLSANLNPDAPKGYFLAPKGILLIPPGMPG